MVQTNIFLQFHDKHVYLAATDTDRMLNQRTSARAVVAHDGRDTQTTGKCIVLTAIHAVSIKNNNLRSNIHHDSVVRM